MRHTLRCEEPDCADCAYWRDMLESGSPAFLAEGRALQGSVERGSFVERAAVSVVRAVATARDQPGVALRLNEVENALQALAKLLEEPLPPPRRKLK